MKGWKRLFTLFMLWLKTEDFVLPSTVRRWYDISGRKR